jgi:protease-4
MSSENWERDTLNRLAFATLNEQRQRRRWRTLFWFVVLISLFVVYLNLSETEWFKNITENTEKHTALIEINGSISAKSDTNASADNIITGLRNAFKHKNTQGIILRINSPGGSPVQAGYVADEIKRLRETHPKIPVYAVATDLCASGGYYIAVAADKIYADKASIIGSIGVVSRGFGFVKVMEKLGIERRLLTAGESKGFLDSYSPTKPSDINHFKVLLDEVHQQFIHQVKTGRAKSLEPKSQAQLLDNPKLYTGLVWTGENALELGLIDGLASSSYVAREIIKAEKIKKFTFKKKKNYLDRFAKYIGATIVNSISQQFNTTTTTLQ